ncbi:MAG: iron-containing alcohol dehydrogenase [Oscillospiraceae bacterium]|nr:iron-containing alcohol dehydrogenase [Oscillospiraceae bacterium]
MEFYLPVRLLTGDHILSKNAERIRAYGSRCLIVTSGSAARRCGALDDVTAVLSEIGTAYAVYNGIQPNPSISSCLEGGRIAKDFGAEFVIGIGGGSPLDAAKVVAVSAANPELDERELYTMNWPKAPLPVILVGTTAGTGSEVTPVAVITNSAGFKKSFRGESMYAALSFGDPRYTASMPLRVTASTGVDALAHCLESYFSRKATDVSRAFALQGIAQLLPPLQHVAEGVLPDPQEREILYHGSLLGGMAISVTGTVMPHNMGYYLTEQYGIPHGFACAAFLPALLRHAAAADPVYSDALYRRVGMDGEAMTVLIRALTPDSGVCLSAEEIEALLPRWENNASIQKTIGEITKDQIRQILQELFLR